MQTFLPYPAFADVADILDPKRLGKQRSEALVILRVAHNPTYGWQNHPAVRMWRGYDDALVAYGVAICEAWKSRGHADTVLEKLALFASGGTPRRQDELAADGLLPPWLGDPRLHRSHQSALLRKDPEWYGKWFADVPADLPYYWPV